MKNKQLFDKTLDILVDAYMNDKLIHSDCAACAVGNIIQANGIQLVSEQDDETPTKQVYYQKTAAWLRLINEEIRDSPQGGRYDRKLALEQIAVTGYTCEELNRIEKAFECHNGAVSGDQKMFNSLMQVVDALIEIHEGEDDEREISKSLFVKVESAI